MDAVLLSGGIPKPEDPLYEYTLGEPKALIDICGKSMIQWVLDALEKAATVTNIIVVGIPQGVDLASTKIKSRIPSKSDLLENVRFGVMELLKINPNASHALISSSDIPAITAESVNWVVQETQKTDLDLYYNVITRQVMEKRFPKSKRSYTRLKDVELCGGDMNVIRTSKVTEDDELYRKIMDARKNAFKQASLIGIDTLLLLLLRRCDLESAVKRVESKLNLTGQAILCPYAEVGMDVDKPHQLEILRTDLSKRSAA
ncbi:MAG: NTP transferase domain-containing protein [Anaerolineales bacterium]|jgi:GTP:adenosylcobinamide-phosphate guanylyltransferase